MINPVDSKERKTGRCLFFYFQGFFWKNSPNIKHQNDSKFSRKGEAFSSYGAKESIKN